ncbi:MAG TPA: 3-dehydroquinate synthase [Leptolyngbya sp.]|nr:3-dehydroquinate synthase [Leptolyngbya sp.]
MSFVIPVSLPQNAYDIAIAAIDELGDRLQTLPKLGRKALIVSNPAIFKHYGQRVTDSLTQAGFTVDACLLPAGERYKTPATLQKIYDAALENRLERSSVMVALGGGVIGDMTGFAAATWLRGISVVQVPTSLLAMVDAAIGGKTGVNHPHGKNLIGAFHQPRLVLIDPQVLKTLPAREFRAAIAEVIKYGIIWDAELFETLEQAQRLDQIRFVGDELVQTMLVRSAQAKAHVVSKDEKESGLREILNYGHTIGHAIESLTNYRSINHGEGVAIGMMAAGLIAVEMGLWKQTECDRQKVLIEKAGLPTQIPEGVDRSEILPMLQADKKVRDGKVRFVLPQQIGTAIVTDQVASDVIQTALNQM